MDSLPSLSLDGEITLIESMHHVYISVGEDRDGQCIASGRTEEPGDSTVVATGTADSVFSALDELDLELQRLKAQGKKWWDDTDTDEWESGS